jgi:F0F1-type ATP synthase membrane subunit b/b'
MLDFDFAAITIVFLLVWILVFILNKIFFNPIRKVRDERASILGGNRGAFRQASEAHEQNIQKIEATLKSAKNASEAIRDGLEAEAMKEKSRIISGTSVEFRNQVLEARQELEEKIKGLKKELEAQAGGFAEHIEQRLLD